MTLAMVVPVKSPLHAKHRLEPVLSEPERERLAVVMAREVFAAGSTPTQDRGVLVSDDPEILGDGPRFALEPLTDPLPPRPDRPRRPGVSAPPEPRATP